MSGGPDLADWLRWVGLGCELTGLGITAAGIVDLRRRHLNGTLIHGGEAVFNDEWAASRSNPPAPTGAAHGSRSSPAGCWDREAVASRTGGSHRE